MRALFLPLQVTLLSLFAMTCALLSAGCAGTHSVSRSVGGIAQRLVDRAMARTDLRAATVCVEGIHPTHPGQSLDACTRSRPSHERDPIARELERELVLALSYAMCVVDSELWRGATGGSEATDAAQAAEHCGATHVVMGHYTRTRDELEVSVQFVEAATPSVVAASAGTVLMRGMSNLVRERTNTDGPGWPWSWFRVQNTSDG